MHGFDYRKIALYGARDRRRLLGDAGIVRNRAKVDAAVANAKAFMMLQREQGSFAGYLRRFPGSKAGAEALSRDLLKRGFKFVGSTIMYAFMQAVGMVDDHEPGCFRSSVARRRRRARR